MITRFPQVALLAVGVAASAFSASANTLYITQYSGTSGAIVDTVGLTTINTFTTGVQTETAIAVRNTVRILNGFPNTGGGSEYDLSGNVLNPGIYVQNSFTSLYDGTTDGRYNYAIDHNGNGLNQVFRFDLNWQNPVALFAANQRSSGISYDPGTDTLWTTGGASSPSGKIQQYSMTGTLISEFLPSLSGNRYGIAFDPLSNTLWTGHFGDGSSKLMQYSTLGVLLQQVVIPGLNFDNPFGMEFQQGSSSSVPDGGATIALLGCGLMALAGVRHKLFNV